MPAAEDGYASREHENLIRRAAGLPVREEEPEKPFSIAEMLREAGADVAYGDIVTVLTAPSVAEAQIVRQLNAQRETEQPKVICEICEGTGGCCGDCQACQGTGFQPLVGEAVEF